MWADLVSPSIRLKSLPTPIPFLRFLDYNLHECSNRLACINGVDLLIELVELVAVMLSYLWTLNLHSISEKRG